MVHVQFYGEKIIENLNNIYYDKFYFHNNIYSHFKIR